MPITARSLKNFQVEVDAHGHQFIVDEPVSVGGDDAGPDPYDILLGALAGCKIITVQMYARRKGWPLEGVQVSMSHNRVHAEDCEDYESETKGMLDLIEVDISFEGDLTGEQVDRLKQISERCPVHKTLTSDTKIETKLVAS